MDINFSYPSTCYLPWSDKRSSKENRNLSTVKQFEGKEVVCLEKIDGSNDSLLTNACLPRSMSTDSFMYGHESRNWIKAFHSEIAFKIPEWMIISIENMFYQHTIFYDLLPSFAMGICIWNLEKRIMLSFDETLILFKELNIPHMPILYRGIWNEKEIKKCYLGKSKLATNSIQEGYVVRLASEIKIEDFSLYVSKYVSKKFAIPPEHWSKMELKRNKLK